MENFIHSLGDFHIYEEHFDQVKIQLKRKPKKLTFLEFKTKNFFKYKVNDFKLINYELSSKNRSKNECLIFNRIFKFFAIDNIFF